MRLNSVQLYNMYVEDVYIVQCTYIARLSTILVYRGHIACWPPVTGYYVTILTVSLDDCAVPGSAPGVVSRLEN